MVLSGPLGSGRGAQVPVDAEDRGSGPVPATLQCREGQAALGSPQQLVAPVWASSVDRTAVPPAWAPRGLLRCCMEVLGGCLSKGLDSLLLSPPQRGPPALLQKKEAGRCWCCGLWGAALEAWAARSRQSPHLPGPAPLRSHVPCPQTALPPPEQVVAPAAEGLALHVKPGRAGAGLSAFPWPVRAPWL